MSRGEGELLTVPKPRAVRLLSVYLAVKPVGEPDAGDRHVRFDERGWETERCRMAQATAPILDSTKCELPTASRNVWCWRQSGKHLLALSISHFDPLRTSSFGKQGSRSPGRASISGEVPPV